ncbi:MAG TPA: hypothetical protein VK991_07790, partial [Halomonas sp.]|nr:hypothetical protein [Halomonas sp.]
MRLLTRCAFAARAFINPASIYVGLIAVQGGTAAGRRPARDSAAPADSHICARGALAIIKEVRMTYLIAELI